MTQRHHHDVPFTVVREQAGNGYTFNLVDTRSGEVLYECWTRSPIPPESMRRIQGLKNTRAVLDGD